MNETDEWNRWTKRVNEAIEWYWDRWWRDLFWWEKVEKWSSASFSDSTSECQCNQSKCQCNQSECQCISKGVIL